MSESSFFVEPTNVLFEPEDDPLPDGPRHCKHCRQWLGTHWKHEDGRITCTRPKRRAEPQEAPK